MVISGELVVSPAILVGVLYCAFNSAIEVAPIIRPKQSNVQGDVRCLRYDETRTVGVAPEYCVILCCSLEVSEQMGYSIVWLRRTGYFCVGVMQIFV